MEIMWLTPAVRGTPKLPLNHLLRLFLLPCPAGVLHQSYALILLLLVAVNYGLAVAVAGTEYG